MSKHKGVATAHTCTNRVFTESSFGPQLTSTKVATVCVVSRRKSLENFRFRLVEGIVLDFISNWMIDSMSPSGKLQITFDAFSNGILLLAQEFYPLLDV